MSELQHANPLLQIPRCFFTGNVVVLVVWEDVDGKVSLYFFAEGLGGEGQC